MQLPSPGCGRRGHSQRPAERLMQQRFFQFVERVEFALVAHAVVLPKLTKNYPRALNKFKKIYAGNRDCWHRAHGWDLPFRHHVGRKLLSTFIRDQFPVMRTSRGNNQDVVFTNALWR